VRLLFWSEMDSLRVSSTKQFLIFVLEPIRKKTKVNSSKGVNVVYCYELCKYSPMKLKWNYLTWLEFEEDVYL
jgi:hypothetical protein